MNKKVIYPQIIFVLALAVLSGCTPYMKGSRQLDQKDYLEGQAAAWICISENRPVGPVHI
jgi:hypothetical protein